MSSSRQLASSIVVDGGLVSALDGSNSDPDAVVIDLDSRCVVPGFADSHVHFLQWSMAQRQIRLEGCRSLREVIDTVRRTYEEHPRNGWIIGHGWRPLDWETVQQPTRQDLDAVSMEIPIMLRSKDGHSIWLNSIALAAASGDLTAPGGVVVTDDIGEPTGVLREECAWRFEDRHVKVSDADYLRAVRDGVRVANARGVTSVHDKDGGIGALGVWQQLRDEGDLTLRVWQSFPASQLDQLSSLHLRSGLGDDLLRAGYLKTFMDGSLGSQTAYLSDGSGVCITDREGLEELVSRAAEIGWPIAVHAIGDQANHDALDAFEATRDRWASLPVPQRIEHAQLIDPKDLPRFAELGVAASVQFSHATADRDLVDATWAPHAEHAYPFRSLWDAGALVANGSDAPIDELDPIRGIKAAVARTNDDRPGWRLDQALTTEEALIASTVNPARLTGDGNRRGKLLPGRVADLVVLDRDPLACSPTELSDIQVIATMLDGRWVSGDPPWG